MPTIKELRAMQSMSLDEKILLTQRRVEEWYVKQNGNVYIAFSGGKDSTVMLHIIRDMFPEVPAVFINTGLEYPEVRKFALSFDNVSEFRPKWGFRKCRGRHDPDDTITFMDVVLNYGYPIITKDVANSIYASRKSKDSSEWKKLTGAISDDFNSQVNKAKFDHMGRILFGTNRR